MVRDVQRLDSYDIDIPDNNNNTVLYVSQSRESDSNRDGKHDALSLSIQFAGLSHQVHTVKLLLFFRVEFNVSKLTRTYII